MKPKGLFKLRQFRNASGTLSYRVSGTPNEVDAIRIQRNFASRDDAVAFLHDLQDKSLGITDRTKLRRTLLDDPQLRDAERATELLGGRVRLTDAVEAWLANHSAEPAPRIAPEQVLTRFLDEKRTQGNRRERTISNLRSRIGGLFRSAQKPSIAEVTTQDIKDYVFRVGVSPTNQSNDLRALHSFWVWSIRHGHALSNPLVRIDRPRLERKTPEILTVDQCQKLLDVAQADGRCLAYCALGLFAGLRSTELLRLAPQDIDLNQGLVTVRSEAAKLRQRRVVELPDAAIAWLKACPQPLDTRPPRKRLEHIRARAGIAKTNNLVRHTALSMRLAQSEDEAKTALWAGNSPGELHRSYKGLVNRKTALKFWALRPTRTDFRTSDTGPHAGIPTEKRNRRAHAVPDILRIN